MKLNKHHFFKRILGVLSVFLSACVSHPSFSQDLTPSQLYYYEGNQRVELSIQDGILAEFDAVPPQEGKQTRSRITSVDKGATLIKNRGTINIWKSDAQGGSVATAKSLNENTGGKFSPVFQASLGGGILSLPGNVIVEFTPNMSKSQVENFLGTKGLRIFKQLDLVGRNFYEVETPAGAAALNIANSLVGQSGVVSSTPNWWREAVAK